jgi:hypothetical protein
VKYFSSGSDLIITGEKIKRGRERVRGRERSELRKR